MFSIRKYIVFTERDVERALVDAGCYDAIETPFGQVQRELIRHYMNRRRGYALFVGVHGNKKYSEMKLTFAKKPADEGMPVFIEAARDPARAHVFIRELCADEVPTSRWWWVATAALMITCLAIIL